MFNKLKFRIFLLMIAVCIPAAALITTLAYRSYLSSKRIELATLSTVAEVLSLHVEENLTAGKSLVSALGQTFIWSDLAAADCEARLQGTVEKIAGQAALLLYRNRSPYCRVVLDDALDLENFDPMPLVDYSLNAGFWVSRDNHTYLWQGRRFQDKEGTFSIVSVSSEDFLEKILRDHEGGNGRFSAIVTNDGRLAGLSSEQARQEHEAVLRDGSWFASRLTKRKIGQTDYVYVAAPLASVPAHIVTAQPEKLLYAASGTQLYLAVLTSVFMLLLPIAAIWWGIDRLVLRWLSHYGHVTAAYAAGDQLARMRDPSAAMPLEIAQVATSFNAMADSVAARAAELEEEIKRKQAYVRELHHRVKNILQMIASMLAMEAREAASEQGVSINRASRRIAALGATYAIFYGYSDRGHAPLATVLNEAISRLGLGAPVKAVNYEAAGDFNLNVDLDTSITIAMLLAEYISAFLDSNALGSVNVNVYIGKILDISIDAPHPPQMSVLGERFIKAYLRQLDASMREDDGAVSLRIKLGG